MKKRLWVVLALASLVSIVGLSGAVLGQNVVLSKESYVEPAQPIADVVTAQRHLNVTLRNLSPDGMHILVPRAAGLASLDQFAKPFLNLGEIEFDHQANRLRRFTISRMEALEIWNFKTGSKRKIQPAEGAWVSVPARGRRARFRRGAPAASPWSPDGSQIAYLVHTENEVHLFVAGVDSGESRQLTRRPLLATHVSSPVWSPDGKSVFTVLIPEGRSPMPQDGQVASEPQVRISDEGATPTRTYRFLMQTPHDMALLQWLSTGQIVRIDVQSGALQKVGQPAMYKSIDVSPEGQYLMADILLKPFSYHVPVSSFGSERVIYDMQGQQVAAVQKQELRKSTVRTGPRPPGGGFGGPSNPDDKRSIAWRPDSSVVTYLQREARQRGQRGGRGQRDDGQDSEEEEGSDRSSRKDRVMQWAPPFAEDGHQVVYETENRIGSVQYSQDGQTLFITESEDGQQHLFALKADAPDTKHTIAKFRSNNIFRNPGTLMTRRGDKGGTVVRMSSDGSSAYLSGTKYSRNQLEEAPRPFIHKVEIATGEKETLFESDEDVYEEVTTAVDDDLSVLITTRQTSAMIADSYARELAGGALKKLTSNRDYSPEVTGAKRMRFQVERVDGFKLWLNLTLPPDYVEGTKLPAMFWFYPREYTDQRSYDRSAARHNKNAFPNVGTRSMETLTKLGYAVVQPDCPIIGKQNQMNNNYTQDLRNNLWAVIDFLDKKGYIDRDRLGIGGHSYGAFGTANAMIHTPFFKAGIAGDGNYNRTLTPLTFQSERRVLWEAREVYFRMSPLLWADQLNGALLMYHGIDDANNGTFPINSERMFHVLNGLGKKTVLYNYPYEHHGPATRETLLDLWARWTEWLEVHVKNPQPEEEAPEVEPVEVSGQNR